MALLVGCGDGADIEAAPNSVAPAGDEAVDRVGKEGGNKAENNGDGWPGSGQDAQGRKGGEGADEDLGVGGERLADDEDRAGCAGGFSRLRVGSEQVGYGVVMGGNEAQAVIAIMADEPLN